MKAYRCDKCGKFFQGAPLGIFYDNENPTRGVRYDLCPECTGEVLCAITAEENEGEEK